QGETRLRAGCRSPSSDSITPAGVPINTFVLQQRLFSVAAVVGACALAPTLVLELGGSHDFYLPALAHFLAVGLSASAATFAGLTLSVVGARRRDARTVIVGTAFATMASLLAVHALAIPGVVVGPNSL